MAWFLVALAALALAAAQETPAAPPSDDKARLSAADEVEAEHARLHQAVVNAVPVNKEKSTATMWKTAKPSAEKVQAASAVVAGDWSWGGSGGGSAKDEKKSAAIDAAAAQVEEERARLHKSVQEAVPAVAGRAESRAATMWKTAKPAAKKGLALAAAVQPAAAQEIPGAPPSDDNARKEAVDEVEAEHARLHQAVMNAVPANKEKSSATMWKTAKPAAEKVQAAAAVVADDWSWGGSGSSPSKDEKKPAAYTSTDAAVEEERARLHKSVQEAVPADAGRAESRAATLWKTAKPAAAKPAAVKMEVARKTEMTEPKEQKKPAMKLRHGRH